MSAPTTKPSTLVNHGCITPARACYSKRAYWTKNDADHAIKLMRRDSRRQDLELRRYRCPFAKGGLVHWHLTSAPKED